MDNIYLDTYWFFVPNRLVWTHWRELMGENTSSAWLPDVEYSVPQIYLFDNSTTEGSGAVKTGDVLDYMGVPVGVSVAYQSTRPETCASVNALPLRAYDLVYDSWFRDENLVDPVNIQKGDTSYVYYSSYVTKEPYKAAKYHDYFTSGLPAPQKGPGVSVPAGFDSTLNGNSLGWPVTTLYKQDWSSDVFNLADTGKTFWPIHLRDVNGADSSGYVNHVYSASDYVATSSGGSPTKAERPLVAFGAVSDSDTSRAVYIDNLFAMPGTGTNTGLFVDVNDLRYAFQLQKLYERDARGGTRYIELIRSHFGVDSPDARMQRPEYLGGNRIPVSIHQITNQSQGESDFLGDLGAMSLTTDKHGDFVKSFTEHGILIGLCVMRYDHSYPQGLERMWSRKSRFDYYWPVFANLGEQAILKKEIYLSGDPDSDDSAFAYQERWAEYRYKPNRVAGEMRPGISNTLASWHFADYYQSAPSLSASWIAEDKSNVDRTLAVTSTNANQFFADIYVQNFTTRPMPLYSVPGLIDHH